MLCQGPRITLEPLTAQLQVPEIPWTLTGRNNGRTHARTYGHPLGKGFSYFEGLGREIEKKFVLGPPTIRPWRIECRKN